MARKPHHPKGSIPDHSRMPEDVESGFQEMRKRTEEAKKSRKKLVKRIRTARKLIKRGRR